MDHQKEERTETSKGKKGEKKKKKGGYCGRQKEQKNRGQRGPAKRERERKGGPSIVICGGFPVLGRRKKGEIGPRLKKKEKGKKEKV